MENDNNIDAKTNVDASNIDTIGILLKNARENRNEDLTGVSSKLRIRQVYLEAIENNQFNTLPGDIYVVGFIRSYSTYLGLDSEQIVERYKTGVGKAETQGELIFPSYVPENGIPSGAVLLLGLILAIVGYSGWYFLSIKNTFNTSQVANVPEPLTGLVEGKPIISESPKKNKIAVQKKKSDKNFSNNGNIAKKKGVKEIYNDDSNDILGSQIKSKNPITNPQEPAQKLLTSNANKIEPIAPKTSIQESSASKENPPKQIASKPDTITPAEPIKELKLEPTTAKELGPSPNNKTDKSLDNLAKSNDKPSVGIETSSKSPSRPQPLPTNPPRIILEAITDSYIQVRDTNINKLLITRLLKQGQQYKIPDRSGLTLITGNAGALKILVDGTQVPAIGPIGAIRRNVILDPIKLKDGLAVVE
jgi:cytoskeleton protein RodZ